MSHEHCLRYIPKDRLTRELILNILKEDGSQLSLVPVEMLDEEMCSIAVKTSGRVLEHIPPKFRTEEIVLAAIRTRPGAIVNVLDEPVLTDEMCEIALKGNPKLLKNFNPDFACYEKFCHIAVKTDGNVLEYVPDNFKTPYLCRMAVKQNGISITHVPNEYRTPSLWNTAVASNGFVLKYVPLDVKITIVPEIIVDRSECYSRTNPCEHRVTIGNRVQIMKSPDIDNLLLSRWGSGTTHPAEIVYGETVCDTSTGIAVYGGIKSKGKCYAGTYE